MNDRTIDTQEQAYLITVSMGYGHRRPAHALRSIAAMPPGWEAKDLPVEGSPIIVANDYSGIPDSDRRFWKQGRTMYEAISRYRNVPIIGQAAWAIMDYMQQIEPIQTTRDLTKPTLQLRSIYKLISKGFGKHLIDWLNENPKPLVTTFFTVAFFAEEHGYKGEIYCVCTDSDVSRSWAPLNPKSTRINYLAPSERVYERLQKYGVPQERITMTGFPLPSELIGAQDETAKSLHGNRLHRLQDANAPLTIMYPVGGAGAQMQTAIDVLDSCAELLNSGKLRLQLVAGSRPEVKETFEKELTKRNLLHSSSISLIFHENTFTMFSLFDEALKSADAIWTKPSELSFFAGIGMPIIMTKPLGSQEDFNRDWLLSMNAGKDQMNPKDANSWLLEWKRNGTFAALAKAGYNKAPRQGVYAIPKEVFTA